MDLPATWSVTLGSAWVIGVPESGWRQSPSKLSSSKAGGGQEVSLGRSGPQPLEVEAERPGDSHWSSVLIVCTTGTAWKEAADWGTSWPSALLGRT